MENVSFVELGRVLEANGVQPKGNESLWLTEYPNTILWSGMSAEFCEVVMRLRNSGLVTWKPTSFLAYMADGECLRLPLAKRPSKKGYRKPHWAPIVFNAVKRCTHPPPPKEPLNK
jgi:hypothetical protein